MTEQSIGALFVAGIIPAIFITICFAVAISIYCRIYPLQGPAGDKVYMGREISILE